MQDLIDRREKMLNKVFTSNYNTDRKINLRNNKVYDEAMLINNDLIKIIDICDELLIETIVETMVETMVETIIETTVERIVEIIIETTIETIVESNAPLKMEKTLT